MKENETKKEDGEGKEEGPKTVRFVGPGAFWPYFFCLCVCDCLILVGRLTHRQPPPPPKKINAVEWKGIKGADGRCYMLDLVRVTPRDPNWIKEDWRNPSGSGTGVWERAGCVV